MAGFCGNCGLPRIEGARFCTGCGTDLSTMPIPCPTCGQPWVPPVEPIGSVIPAAPTPILAQAPIVAAQPVAPVASGMPRGPALGEDYVPGQDCGNCGEPLRLRDGLCELCGSRNTGPSFDPSLLS